MNDVTSLKPNDMLILSTFVIFTVLLIFSFVVYYLYFQTPSTMLVEIHDNTMDMARQHISSSSYCYFIIKSMSESKLEINDFWSPSYWKNMQQEYYDLLSSKKQEFCN